VFTSFDEFLGGNVTILFQIACYLCADTVAFQSGNPVGTQAQLEVRVMGKGNNSQSKEKKKPKKGAKAAPVKSPPPPKK
jgi:hypothetical protein